MNEEAAAAWLKAQEVLDQTEELLRERAERVKAWQPAPEPPRPVQRVEQPRPRTAPQPAGVDWDATKRWVQALIDGRVGKAVSKCLVALGEEVATDVGALEKRIAALETRCLEAELRAGQEHRLAELERRLLEAEQRAAATGPRLVVGGTDAA